MDGTVGDHVDSSAAVPAAPATGGCPHAVAVVGTDQELLDIALPYLDRGCREGDLTMLACLSATSDLFRERLAAADSPVHAETSPTEWGLRPPDLFERWRRYAQQAEHHRSGRLRVLAQPLLPADADGLREHLRTEAVANRVLAQLPMSVLCVYDVRQVPADVVASAVQTHPFVATPDGWRDSDGYQDAPDFVRRLPRPRDPVEDGQPVFAVDDVRSLPELRHRLGAALERHVPGAELREDLHLALSEVAANAFRHGVPPVSARMWADGERICCTITDRGRTFDDPLAGFVPARGWDLSRGGMGLWLARKLWDHVDLFLGPQGFTVRLSTSLHP